MKTTYIPPDEKISLNQWPLVVENFLNQDDLNYLLQYSQNSQELYNAHRSSVEFWNKRGIYYNSISSRRVQKLVVDSAIRMRDIINYNNVN